MINHQLTSSLKEIRQGLLPLWTVEDVFLFYLYPGQLPSLLAQLIPKSGKLFLFDQKTLPGFQPFCR